MRIKFTSLITRLNVDQFLLEMPREQNITRGLENLDACERSRGDGAGAVAGLGAP